MRVGMKSECCIKIVLLDLDGTVIDTMGLYADKAAELISEAIGINIEKARKLYLELAGRPFIEQLELIGIQPPLSDALSRVFEEWKRDLLKRVKVDDNVAHLISVLRRRFKVYISTNNECSVVLDNKHLTRLVDGVLCYDKSTGSRKGEPHIRMLMENENVSPCNILFIGDSEYDIRIYEELGVEVVRTNGLWRSGIDPDSIRGCT